MEERKCSATVVDLDLLLICKCDRVLKTLVRVKGGMSLRGNGMWHGLRNGIIMQNLIYAE